MYIYRYMYTQHSNKQGIGLKGIFPKERRLEIQYMEHEMET